VVTWSRREWPDALSLNHEEVIVGGTVEGSKRPSMDHIATASQLARREAANILSMSTNFVQTSTRT
jgi:hypothetical protein